MRTIAVLICCVAGCFQPSIQDGGFLCAPGGVCPQGFSCLQDHCWSDTGPGPVIVTPDAGVADVIARPEVGPTPRALGETCDPRGAGTPQRSDNCAAGLTCMDGSFQSLCFKLCTDDSQCGDARCETRSAEPGAPPVSVCGLPGVACEPAAVNGCPPQRVCYLSDTRTICEISSGDNAKASCTYSRDCLPSYTCATGVGAGYCRPACVIGETFCPGSTECQRVAGNLGYCY